MEGIKKLSEALAHELHGLQGLRKHATERTFHLLDLASKSCILTNTEDLLTEISSTVCYDKERPKYVGVPIQDKWDLHMADNVRIKSEFDDYQSLKSVLMQTVGWNEKAAQAISHVGIITSICNEYDCHVQAFFPDSSCMAELYAGVLERTMDEPAAVTVSRFKKGDRVAIDAVPEIVELMQKNYDAPRMEMLNKIGEVMAVTSGVVFVTFEGTFSVKINPALLKIKEGNVQYPVFPNSKKILPGTRVRITANLRKFMRESSEAGEWEARMCNLPGKVVTVLLVKDKHILRVCVQAGRSFNVHTSSVLLNDEKDENEEDVPFKIGEWVKIKKTEHLKEILDSKSISISLLEYLEYPARVTTYRSDTECGISYDSIYTIYVPTFVLEKVSTEEATLAQNIFSREHKLDIGSEVYLRLGPPNYVRNTLSANGFDEDILNVATNVATIRGFIGFDNAVIECCDGKLRKINKALLTLPEKYSTRKKADMSHDLAHVSTIVDKVEKGIARIKNKIVGKRIQLCLTPALQCVNLRLGQPSTLCLNIKTPLFGYRDLEQELQRDTTWKFTGQNDDEHIRIAEIDSKSVDIFVRFVFDEKVEEPSYPQAADKMKSEQKTEKNVFIEEPKPQPVKAIRETQQPESDRQDDDVPREPEPPVALEGYRHMEMKIGNERIFVPYRRMQETDHGERVIQEGNDRVASRVEITGIIRNIDIH